jgi:hypothetical protein
MSSFINVFDCRGNVQINILFYLNVKINFLECDRFEVDRTISFIPPDGEFELMSYRLNTHVSYNKASIEIVFG